ncbi:hypothetical protein CPB84DRAFT_1775940 [Gymnopilus junonius]|uniref:Uncharacterized protein n=1 Tax=Gymnopilus junonius TaxID=109634 RepID=A0A9P5NSJ4_GYMJU|nr:hypothetical protein CPB84DRAFT_1775940 [Gymnopilus junonius]
MMSAQTANYPSVYNTQFAFLAKPPPPPQKKRPSPNAPLPAPPSTPPPTPPKYLQRRRSNTFSSIASWAAHVQPGSPAPRSPHRRPSITSTASSRRPSITRLSRRPSISHSRAPSGSLIHLIETPTRTHSTPSVANFDLTALGYNSVFVHFPKTPSTPSPLLRQYQQNHRSGAPDTPVRPTKKTGMKRFRSLSILRPKSSKGRSIKATGAKAADGSPQSKSSKAETIAKRNRAKYAYVRPPPPLANELAMMQFADGGSIESHAKRVMEYQAKAAAGTGASLDGKGGIWWDADEEMEYAHLLGGEDADMKDVDSDVDMDWEEFAAADGAGPLSPSFSCSQNPDSRQNGADKENCPEAPTRRSSVSTVDSDLDPKYLLPLPENEDPRQAPIDDRVLASRRIGGAGMSVLSLPARPRRRAMHLSKPGFLLDTKAFQAPRSPVRASSSSSSATTAAAPVGESKPRGKARRRPAPLKLASSNQVVVVVRRPSAAPPPIAPSPGTVEKTRREFIENSFEPPVSVAPVPRPTLTNACLNASTANVSRVATPNFNGVPAPLSPLANKPAKSKTGVRGFFGIARRAD